VKHLFLIRHAKSSWDNESLSDKDRPLNHRGEQQLAPLRKALLRCGALAGDIHASPALRAQQTLQGILPHPDSETRVHTDPALYSFDYRRLLQWLQNCDDQAKTLAIVGHNPALLELAATLVPHAPFELPTASFIHIRLPIKHWRKLGKREGRLETFLTPVDFSYEAFKRKNQKRHKIAGTARIKDLPSALSEQAESLNQLHRGVVLGLDDEFLHQYRIALRRSRAVAESLAEVTGSKSLRGHISHLKRHAQATSALRDLHVFQKALPKLCGGQPELCQALAQWVGERVEQEQKKLAKRLSSKRYRRSLHSWEDELQSRQFRKLIDKLSTRDIQKSVEHRLRIFNRKTAELLHDAPDEDIHNLRKLLKRIRYLMELDIDSWKPALKILRQRQDLYGRFQDLHVQIELVNRFASNHPDQSDGAIQALLDYLAIEKDDTRRLILSIGGLKAG
jgi:phosphohistidine phosphatase